MTSEAFLELLARDASAVEFEGPLIEARARHAAPEVLAELDRAKMLALRVRETLDNRRRREAELTALFDTASDLAALRDVDAVLQAIVHRARQLLGADAAYLTLNDEDRGDTYMRTTDGSVSARFQRLRLPMGAGLGGLVAQTATPYATASYPDDERFRHTGEIDGAVGEEGLIAILGVPLLLGSRVIGVLFAANRGERPFSRDEVALLGTLAAHAAIAIDTARLLEETRTALAELNDVHALVRDHGKAVERAADAHDRLTDLVLRGGGVEDVAAAVTDVLGGELVVLDSDGRCLAGTGEAPPVVDDDLREAIEASRVTGRTVTRDSLSVAAVLAGSEPLGALVLRGRPALAEVDQRILERSALVTALLLLFRRSVADAESRVRGELLDDLLSTPLRDPDALKERGRLVGLELDKGHAVVVARLGVKDRQRAAATAFRLAAGLGGLAVQSDGDITFLVPHDGDPGALARSIAAELGSALGRPVTAGAAGPTTGPQDVAAARAEAAHCVDALAALGRHGEGASSADLGFVGLVLGDNRDVDGLLDATLGPVLDYDARRGTTLLETLETFFGSGGSLTRTGEALHVHVNTVSQRLDRVGQLLGEGWQEPRRALEVQLALLLHRLRRSPAE